MDVERKPDDTLEFQFKLIDGIIDMSYASLTALKMGIPRDVVDRSEEVNSCLHPDQNTVNYSYLEGRSYNELSCSS